MARDNTHSFIQTAGDSLASIRSSLLIAAQTCEIPNFSSARGSLARLETEATENSMPTVAGLAVECGNSLSVLQANEFASPETVYAALDLIALIEAELFQAPLRSDDFLLDIAGFVDDSFRSMSPPAATAQPAEPREEFEIDEETLDVFRSEADELLTNMAGSLSALQTSPTDQGAIWEIRRCAHTFKGAAGIVGLKDACRIAHQMEDLLDRLVETRFEAGPRILDFLQRAVARLDAAILSKASDEGDLEKSYKQAMSLLEFDASNVQTVRSTPADTGIKSQSDVPVRDLTASTPIVRVSLERLDELIRIAGQLVASRTTLFGELSHFDHSVNDGPRIEALLETHQNLTDEMHAKLLRIRMVKFGTLETRLNRAVHATCLDEKKKAVIEIANGDVEIDTQIIDALIEPLLHLLKNAVVHGIEMPETRRLIGKHEQGKIEVCVKADNEFLTLSVIDDGGGISLPKLKSKARATGIISADEAVRMDDQAVTELIFARGLTTADKLDLNAGRGVGMSIVKQCVESRGGTLTVESQPQLGTSFTIRMPNSVAKSVEPAARPSALLPSVVTETLPPLVLIVDDSSSIRRRTAKFVEDTGYRVITARDGAEALELLLSGVWEPDLIISDVEMPQIDGWAFLEYVKTDANFGHIPVVIATSLEADSHRQRAYDLGASDYLIKPFGMRELAEVLEKFLIAVEV